MKTSRLTILITVLAGFAAMRAQAADSIRWEKQVLTEKYYCDGINWGDFNRDGQMDIVAGPFWYEGSTVFHPVGNRPQSKVRKVL